MPCPAGDGLDPRAHAGARSLLNCIGLSCCWRSAGRGGGAAGAWALVRRKRSGREADTAAGCSEFVVPARRGRV